MRFFITVFLFFCCSFSLGSKEVSQPFLEKPPSLNKHLIEKKISFYKTIHSSLDDKAENFYELALLYIQDDQLSLAMESLDKSLLLDANFTLAKLQLGFCFLWKDELSIAQEWFQKTLIDVPGDTRALLGLEQIAYQWEIEKNLQDKALKIYREIVQFLPDNSDALFYLGSLLAQMDQKEEAEWFLQKCLEITPQYEAAAIQLGLIYYRQKKFDQAKEIFQKYPKNFDAILGLARISMEKENYESGKELLLQLDQERPKNQEIQSMLADVYFFLREFENAKEENQILLQDFGPNDQIYRTLFEIKSHTDPTLILRSAFTASKEDDPDVQAPVVRDFYLYNGASLLIPVFDRWQIEMQAFGGFQKERDIYPPVGMNYYVPYLGAKILSRCFFLQNWNWDLFCSVLRGWNVGEQVNFPFLNTTRFQPGTAFFYNPKNQFLSLDFHFEDFLITDYARSESKYLTTQSINGLYNYHFDVVLHPELEGAFGWIFYSDSVHNVQNYQLLSLRFGPGFMSDAFRLFYDFEHRGFDRFNENYYSFKWQWGHILGVKFNHEWLSGWYLNLLYFHRWEFTSDLIQPVGSYIYVANKQKLTANKYFALMGYRFKDQCSLEIAGHYFRDNFPYREWNIRGNLTLDF